MRADKFAAGLALFTLILAWALLAYNKFLGEHPEARAPILGLAAATVIIYLLGVTLLFRYMRD